MYEPGTILIKKEQLPPQDPERPEAPFPYNRVKVVNMSPVTHPTGPDAPWFGADAQGVIIQPLTDYDANLDEPFGKVRALYDVESIPETFVDVAPQIRVVNATSAQAGETPEEVFAREAPGIAPEPGQIRGRTARTSPLEDPRPNPKDGPLGPVKP